MVLVASFSMRFLVFLYRPLVGEYMDPWLFLSFAYILPELLPVMLMAIVLNFSLHRQIVMSHQADQLYDRLATSTTFGQRHPFPSPEASDAEEYSALVDSV